MNTVNREIFITVAVGKCHLFIDVLFITFDNSTLQVKF